MPSTSLTVEYHRALDDHRRSVRALVPLLVRMALESVAEVLPGTHRLDVFGEVNEDWIPILRIQCAVDAKGGVLFDVEVGHDDTHVTKARNDWGPQPQ